MFFIAEKLGDRQSGQRDAQAGAGRLGHLSVDQRAFRLGVIMRIDYVRLLELEPEIVALAGALADTGENRHAAVLRGKVADQLLNDYGLTDARTAEQPDLSAAQVRLQQVDDFDSSLEHL